MRVKVLPSEIMARISRRLVRLYGETATPRLMERVSLLAGRYGVGNCPEPHCGERLWDQRDAVLIAYGDMVCSPGEKPLQSLHAFLDRYLRNAVSGVHVLPFFPYSSDDGFAVIDFRTVRPELGSWDDIKAIGEHYKLMVDLVLNHVSSDSSWFRNYVNGIAPERDFFIEVDPDTDLSAVVRPRSSPLLRPTQTPCGERTVWATFSDDQVDLNFANPDVLFAFLDILLLYVHKGARIVRLDAIAYLWKRIGTSCIHLPETHEVVKLCRDLLEMLAPGVLLLTETNVPHEENVSYFGDGDEAHMVYQFSLPPLLLHALLTGESRYLCDWLKALSAPPHGCTYFNFTASHDGVGVRPLEGLLPEQDFEALIQAIVKRGGLISKRRNPDGSESPYELNITYFDALADPGHETSDRHIARFLCSQAIMLALQGVPGIYFNSLIAAPNDHAGVRAAGMNRAINRQKWDAAELQQVLDDPSRSRARVFREYLHLLQIRRQHGAFHPDGPQDPLELPHGLFGFGRSAPDGSEQLFAISNLSRRKRDFRPGEVIEDWGEGHWSELIQGLSMSGDSTRHISLYPYQTLWLARRNGGER